MKLKPPHEPPSLLPPFFLSPSALSIVLPIPLQPAPRLSTCHCWHHTPPCRIDQMAAPSLCFVVITIALLVVFGLWRLFPSLESAGARWLHSNGRSGPVSSSFFVVDEHSNASVPPASCASFSHADLSQWRVTMMDFALDARVACEVPEAPGEVHLFRGLQMGFFGVENVGDDIMPPLFAHVLRRALLLELPWLSAEAVEVTTLPCAHPKRLNFYARKHFWVLGGGSVLDWTHDGPAGLNLSATCALRREPLYLFGAGWQLLPTSARHESLAAFLRQYNPGGPLLWGGVRGRISSGIVDLAAPPHSEPIPVLGDPGFFVHLLSTPALNAEAVAALKLSARFIVSTCGKHGHAVTLRALGVEHRLDIVVAAISNFSSRSHQHFVNGSKALAAAGARVRTLALARPRDLATLLYVLEHAEAGVHCTLHGAIAQASMLRPSLMSPSIKVLDAFGNSPLIAMQPLLVEGSVFKGDTSWRIIAAMERAGEWALTLRAYRESVLAAHIDAMREFVRHLLFTRYPEVGRIITCAMHPSGIGGRAPVPPTIEIRSFIARDGAVIDVVLKGSNAVPLEAAL